MKDYDVLIMEGLTSHYGIRKLTLEEELNQPENAKRTRRNKMSIIDTCHHARSLLETIENRARMAEELDDEGHSALVQELADKVAEAYRAVERAEMVGWS